MGLWGRLKSGIQIVVGGHSQGRVIVKGVTANSGSLRAKQGEDWLAAYSTMPWLRANVSKIAHGVASLEWGITRTMGDNGLTIKRPDIQKGGPDYRRKALAAMEEEGKAEAIFDHPFLSLWKNPCPALPGGAARKLAQIYYEVVGEVFFVIDRGPRDGWIKSGFTGRPLPTALWPIPPTWVKRVPTPDNPTFEIRHLGLQLNDIPLSEVLWLKDADPVNPYGRGVGMFFSLNDELDADENAARMIGYSFYNRNRPDVLVSVPNASDIELTSFRNEWIANLQGVQNTLKSHFVNVEADVQQIGYDFREMQVMELRRGLRDTIRQVPGTPPEMLGIQDQSNRSTIEAAEFIFNKHVIEPRGEVWREFLSSNVLVEYDPRAVLDYVSPSTEDKTFALQVMATQPEIFRVNEKRKLAGTPALPEAEGGKMFFVNGAFVPSLLAAPAAAPATAAPGAGGGLSQPGFDGGINVPGAPTMHLSIPQAAGSRESGVPAALPSPALAGGPPAGAPPPPGPPKKPGGFPFGKGVTKGLEVSRLAGRATPIQSADVSPDVAKAVGRWARATGSALDLATVLDPTPIPVTEDRKVEFVRRGVARLSGRTVKGWNRMFGPWTSTDDEMLDSLLGVTGWAEVEKGERTEWVRDDDGKFAETPGGGGSEAPAGGGDTKAEPVTAKTDDAHAGTAARFIAAEATTPPRGSDGFNPHVENDANGDGVTDAARVGVPAAEVPPPPTVPRLPNLTPKERAIESKFADAYEADPEGMARKVLEAARADGNKFETDGAKVLVPEWAGTGPSDDRAEFRSTMNLSLHQTANAVTKRAFLMHLDEMSDADKAKGVIVTVGGCGAGKGFGLKNLAGKGYSDFNAKNYGAVWDSAGDQNATENPWILEEATKRGIPVTYAYVSADPEVSWADEGDPATGRKARGVVSRAMDPGDGRMVDASVFADSYVIGAKNHAAFAKVNAGKAKFVYVSNGDKIEQLDGVPESDLKRDRKALLKFSISTLEKRKVPARIRRAALSGARVWKDNK